MTILQNTIQVLSSTTSVFALVGVLALVVALIKFKKIEFTTKIMVQVAIAVAMATILQFIKFAPWAQGGSVTLGSMVPILIIAFVYGPELGLLTGFVFGLLSLILNPYILHPVQVLFDYPLPFMAIGLAGYFKEKKMIGVIVAMFLRFACHYISGVVFFGSYAPEGMSAYLYSLIYNGSYMSLETIISLVIIGLLPFKSINRILKGN